jgi:hypothetical protein
MRRRGTWICLMALACVLGGCYRSVLNQERTLDVRPGFINEILVDPISRDQNIKIEFTASSPVSVYVLVEKDKETVKREIESRKEPLTNVLARKDKADNGSFEVPIAANNTAVVLVTHASKPTQVTLKLTN